MDLLITNNETLGDYRIYRSAHFEDSVIVVECDGFWDVLHWSTIYEHFSRGNHVSYEWSEDSITFLWDPVSKSTMYRRLKAILKENGIE